MNLKVQEELLFCLLLVHLAAPARYSIYSGPQKVKSKSESETIGYASELGMSADIWGSNLFNLSSELTNLLNLIWELKRLKSEKFK